MAANLTVGDGGWSVTGELSFNTVPVLYEQARGAFATRLPDSVDLVGVERVDSAGVALMLEWIRTLKAHGRSLKFRNIPPHMASIAELCGVGHLFTE